MEYVITKQNFKSEVLEADLPVVLDFYADWCGPCKMMGPILHEFAEKMEGKIKVGKLNIDADVEVAQQYRIMSVPSFVVFKNGEKIGAVVGAMSLNDFEKKIEEILK